MGSPTRPSQSYGIQSQSPIQHMSCGLLNPRRSFIPISHIKCEVNKPGDFIYLSQRQKRQFSLLGSLLSIAKGSSLPPLLLMSSLQAEQFEPGPVDSLIDKISHKATTLLHRVFNSDFRKGWEWRVMRMWQFNRLIMSIKWLLKCILCWYKHFWIDFKKNEP